MNAIETTGIVDAQHQLRLEYVFSVAQIGNLLYRRIAFCGTSASASALEISGALPITNRRYGRLLTKREFELVRESRPH